MERSHRASLRQADWAMGCIRTHLTWVRGRKDLLGEVIAQHTRIMRRIQPSEGRDASPLGTGKREKDPLEIGRGGGKAGEEGRTPTSISNKNQNWPLAFKKKKKVF